MMDERRLRARIVAVRIAFPDFPTASQIDGRFGLAEALERWIMRPPPVDVTSVDKPAGTQMIEVSGHVNPALQQPCGAYRRPSWFVGTRWNACTGEHVSEPGPTYRWHRRVGGGGTFATHHCVDQIGPGRCACGADWPCANRSLPTVAS